MNPPRLWLSEDRPRRSSQIPWFGILISLGMAMPGPVALAVVPNSDDGNASVAPRDDSAGWAKDLATKTGIAPEHLASLYEKANEPLRHAIQEDPGSAHQVIAMGHAHQDLPLHHFPERADYVRYFSDASQPFLRSIEEALATTGGRSMSTWTETPAVSVEGALNTLVRLAQEPGVQVLELDEPIHLVRPIEDYPDSAGSPSLSNTEGRRMIQAEDMWFLGFRGEGVRVAVIDTGIDATHEAFRFSDGGSRVAAWKDFVNNKLDPYDDHGHGTHVAGSLAGSSDYDDLINGRFQETGVAPRATLLVAKMLDAQGSGSLSTGISALNWAYEQGADLTSNSWGAPAFKCKTQLSLLQTIRTLADAGMLSVFAAGNDGPSENTIAAPACSEAAVTVGAVDSSLKVASFSSRGFCTDYEFHPVERICPDVVAKGVNVRSAIPRSGATFSNESGYLTWSGTSMAAPHVAGAAALLEQMKRSIGGEGWNTSARQEETMLRFTAMDLGAAGPDNLYGSGLVRLVNAHDALERQSGLPRAEFLLTYKGGPSSDPALYVGDTTGLWFTVANMGLASVTGTFQAELVDPKGAVETLKSSSASLGLGDREEVGHLFVAGTQSWPGTYTFRASFQYTWTDGSGTVHAGTLGGQETFVVKRPLLTVHLDGFNSTTLTAVPEQVTVTVTNEGNVRASHVGIRFFVPDAYDFAPPDGFNAARPNTIYAVPEPDALEGDDIAGIDLPGEPSVVNVDNLTIIYSRYDGNHAPQYLYPSSSFQFKTKLVPILYGGEDYFVVASLTYWDAWNKFRSSWSFEQTVVVVPGLDIPVVVPDVGLPAQDDAGSGTDAPNARSDRVRIRSGIVYQGNVTAPAGDKYDWYAFEGRTGDHVELRVSSVLGCVLLEDPQGVTRLDKCTGALGVVPGTGAYSLTMGSTGTWHFQYESNYADTYRFSLGINEPAPDPSLVSLPHL